MGYLKCEKCGGYYELQDGESPADFEDICECGGQLNYVQNLDDFSNIVPDSNDNNLNNHETLDDYLNHTSSNENTAAKNNKVSSDKLTSQKANPHSTKNKNPKVNNIKPILNWWQKQNQNKKICLKLRYQYHTRRTSTLNVIKKIERIFYLNIIFSI